jgi:heme exporter protein D
MDNIAEFLTMGGYAGYVWPAFGIVLFVMALLWISSMRSWRKSEQSLASLRSHRRQRESVKE